MSETAASEQGAANPSAWPLDFMNEVLWAHSHAPSVSSLFQLLQHFKGTAEQLQQSPEGLQSGVTNRPCLPRTKGFLGTQVAVVPVGEQPLTTLPNVPTIWPFAEELCQLLPGSH